MNSSEFMDKQIMEHSRSQTNDFLEFSDPQEEDHSCGVNRDDFFFHPIRPLGASHSHPSTIRNSSSLDRIDSVKVTPERLGTFYDVALISEIDRTMKEHADNLLHAVEGLSARLSQLESKTRHLENSVDDLKESVEYNHGITDGKLRQLENILREVHAGVHFLRDKQEIAEVQLQLTKLQVSKGYPQSQNQTSAVQTDSAQQASSSAPQQPHQSLPISVAPEALSALPPNAPPTLPCQNPPPPTAAAAVAQLTTQLPQNQVPSIPQPYSCYLPPGQTPETTHQQYHTPPMQLSQPPPPALNQPYQPAPQFPQISQVPQLPQLHPPLSIGNPQLHPPSGHHPDETPYMPSHGYCPSIHQSSSQLPCTALPTQQFYVGATQQMGDQSSSRRPTSEFHAGYSLPPGPTNLNDLYPYSGYPSRYHSSTMKPLQLSPSPSVLSGGSSYPQLPTAQILPHALPTASSVGGGSGSGGTGNRVPIDDVVDKVSAMGFPRDLVRATVRKLTENGQSVDPNVVLDKLMNNGEVRQEKSWFGR